MRDAKKDLALCNQATPGPWIVLPEKYGCDGIDGECSSDQVGCWKKYFLEVTDHEAP